MKAIKTLGSFTAVMLGLAGCAGAPHCPPLPGGPEYCLQACSAVPAYTALQDVHLRRKDLDERLIVQLEVDAEGMRLAGLTPMGQRVLDAGYDNRTAWASGPAADRFDARALLSLVQLASWPAENVRTGLGEDWQLEESAAWRRVLRDDHVVLEIRRSGTPPSYSRLDIAMPRAELTLSVEAIKDEDGK